MFRIDLATKSFFTAMSAILFLGLSSVHAQDIPTEKEFNLYTSGGVDLFSLQFKLFSKDISVGSGEFPSKLSLVRESGQYPRANTYGAYVTHNFNLSAICSPCGTGVTVSTSQITGSFTFADNRLNVKAFDGTHTFISPPQNWGTSRTWTNLQEDGATVIDNGATLEFRSKNGDRIFFASNYSNGSSSIGCSTNCRRPTHAVMANGETIVFSYDNVNTSGWAFTRLTKVVNSKGYGLQFGYMNPSATSGDYTQRLRLTSVQAIRTGCVNGVVNCNTGTLASVSYGWTLKGYYPNSGTPFYRMTSYTNAEGRVLNYTYNGYGFRMSSAHYADTPSVLLFENSYKQWQFPGFSAPSEEGKIQWQKDALGRTTNYAGGNDFQYPRTITTTTVTAPNGEDTVYRFAEMVSYGGYVGRHAMPSRIEMPLGRTLNYTYDLLGRLESSTDAEGGKVVYVHDDRGNVTQTTHYPKTGHSETPIVTSATFPACTSSNYKICNKPSYTVDERGYRTDYQYDVNHGGLKVVLQPRDPNNLRPVTRYYYSSFYPAPSVVAPSGYSLTSASLLTSEYQCLTSGVTGTTVNFNWVCPSTQRNRTDYLYTASSSGSRTNHELEGIISEADSLALRACFKYDKTGNKIAETSPRGGLSSC